MVSNWTATLFICSRPLSKIRRWCIRIPKWCLVAEVEAGVASTGGVGGVYFVEWGGLDGHGMVRAVPMYRSAASKEKRGYPDEEK